MQEDCRKIGQIASQTSSFSADRLYVGAYSNYGYEVVKKQCRFRA
jgi:hypothetical protein